MAVLQPRWERAYDELRIHFIQLRAARHQCTEAVDVLVVWQSLDASRDFSFLDRFLMIDDKIQVRIVNSIAGLQAKPGDFWIEPKDFDIKVVFQGETNSFIEREDASVCINSRFRSTRRNLGLRTGSHTGNSQPSKFCELHRGGRLRDFRQFVK